MLTSEMIGGRIKDFREGKKISQQSMVESLKELGITMSRETLSKIENGNRTVSAVEVKCICYVLDVAVELLLEEYEDDNLVTLFRKIKKINMKEDTIKSVETLQDMIISFMNQKNILDANISSKFDPLWRKQLLFNN